MPIQTSQLGLPLRLVNLISDNNIDWYGVCIFDHEGNILGYRYPNGLRIKLKPIPRDLQTKELAMKYLGIVEALLQPATNDQIAIAIKKLSLQCGMQSRAPEEIKFMIMDYISDLSKYSIKLIEDACAEYRRLPEGNKFMPSSGQLITLMQKKYQKLDLIASRMRKIIGCEPSVAKEMLSIDEAIDMI